MKRACRFCSATDRGATRAAKKDASVRKAIDAKTSAEKREWYRAEKCKRQREEHRSRRDFSDLKVKQAETESHTNQAVTGDHYEVFEDWAARQIVLGKFKDLAGAATGWQKLSQDPSLPWMKVRGQWCLGRFAGVRKEDIDAMSVSRSLEQSKRIMFGQEFDALMERSDETLAKRRRNTEAAAPGLRPSVAPPVLDDDDIQNAVVLSDMLDRSKGFRRECERELNRQARDAEDVEKRMLDELGSGPAEPATQNKPAKEVAKSLAVEQLNLQTALVAWQNKIDTGLAKIKQAADVLIAEMGTKVMCDENCKKEGDEYKATFAEKFAEMNREAGKVKAEMKTQVDAALAAKTLPAAEQSLKELKVSVVEFQVKDGPCQDTRDNLKDIRTFVTRLEKHAAKLLQQRAKAAARKRQLAPDACIQTLPIAMAYLQKLVDDDIPDVNMKHNLEPMSKATHLPAERFQDSLCQPLLADAYYQEQKKWVFKHLTDMGLAFATSDIMRQTVAKRLRDMVQPCVDARLLSSLEATEDEPWLRIMFEFQFFLCMPGHSQVATTSYCLPECRLMLEGSMVVLGVPTDKAPGTSMAAKISAIGSLSFDALEALVSSHGFRKTLSPGDAVVIPPGFIVLEVVKRNKLQKIQNCSGGLRWSFMPKGAGDNERLADALDAMLTSWPSLEGTDFSKLKAKLATMAAADSEAAH